MRFFIDECISPLVAARINTGTEHSAIHPRDIGRRGDPDHLIVRRAIDRDEVIVTENARDFRGLVGKVDLHPGLIILPCVTRDESLRLLVAAIAFLERVAANRGETPADCMVNTVIEVDRSGRCQLFALPDTA